MLNPTHNLKLFAVLMDICPKQQQKSLLAHYNEIPVEDRPRWLAGSIADGVLYGNWPWTDANASSG